MGTQLVRRETLIALLLLAGGCRPGAAPPAQEAKRQPSVDGRIVAVQSTLPDTNRVIQHEVVEANGLVRSTDEVDRWRLIDVKGSKVIFVDDIAATQREMSLAELRERKQRLSQGSIPSWYPQPVFRKTGEARTILGREADQYILQVGGFTRELWISREPLLGADYMALRFGSDEPGGPAPAALARIHLELMELQGFPLIDRISMPVGQTTWGVAREVRAIREGAIARSLFEIPREYGETEQTPSLTTPSYPVPAPPR